jgi:hypothetical protein
MPYDPLDPDTDPFKPPAIPTEVFCLHCKQVFESYLIEWRVETAADGAPHGFWCCPNSDCGGRGFGFDLLPTDPEYRDERGGWVRDDADDGEEGADDFAEDAFDDLPPAGEAPDDGNLPW